ncbi:MAG TPA: N-acetyl-alpha-D-glucosaminyl L-malate synthase BshA [Chitinophagales bacterium]|jgi:N-acetyl-alpha-D-glucosaminyl L-malate synthase BshA|nr:N-acetyl-alpha-D-glucosaminyl L-malate synthase BshA [Chitinophagales bacterium]MBP6154916.1 N-acetyl-alpha-D-glucosaminyl L-malate synthase BshA [Chitinophagales bacterium]HQV76929.1 N-acetyl-alpha-D-glucosaminyl L-malate synthase BshA [Chitinophagales bacterium]HQW78004.1 N-acetyl-alpha-D-glucosaminyl L-malate synthase BshA [Chitinophagales bacterium]HRB18731.1 N-acetyl-alpha-D-glucosaminyl L-malate synthase BshA [Chitinophagales bacterium]
MNIGIVCYPTFGGSGVVATELGKGLAQKGHKVHFITYKEPARLLDTFNENIFFHEVSLNDYPLFDYAPYETALASKLVDVAMNANLDIFHVHYAIPHASAAYMARQILLQKGKNVPVITTLHGTDITLVGRDATYEPVVTYSINQSCGVTAVSESLRRDTFTNFDIKNEIEVIPNFIDFSRFKKTNKDHFKKAISPKGEKIIVHTSNFRKVKRVEDVIHVFCKISEKIPAKLLMIGDGPERQNAEKLVRSLCDKMDVRFLGKQEAVEELLAIADVFLLPSESESFGLSALEAMACEVPVVSSNAGGIPEVNIDGETGFLLNVGDVQGMANRCLELLQDEAMLAQFKKNAFAQAQRFDITSILPKYEAFYIKIKTKGDCK